MTGPLRLGVVGAGGFASFAVPHLIDVGDVVATAVADAEPERAARMAADLGAEVVPADELVRHGAVDVVYLATPPASHWPLGLAAVEAGKHVLCEKPLATTVEDADALVAAAQRHDRFATANLLQRYNPLARAVGELIRRRLLGAPLRITIENFGRTRGLPPVTGSGTGGRAAASSSSTRCTSSTSSPTGWVRAKCCRRPGSSGRSHRWRSRCAARSPTRAA